MKRAFAIGAALGAALVWLLAREVPVRAGDEGPQAAKDAAFGCLAPPSIAPTLPADALLTEQPEVNCFAWQEFVALNWRASATNAGAPDPAAGPDTFGIPGATAPVVWGTYKEASELFPKGGAVPAPWNASQGAPTECGTAGLAASARAGYKVLAATSKFSADLADRDVLDEVNEAGIEPPAWLTDQRGRNVYYEVRVNQDYFNYVVDPQNAFYDARNQWAATQPGGQGIDLPDRPSPYGAVGAIEVKAGWLELDPAEYDQFLVTDAVIVEPGAPTRCRPAKVGLVGLHVIHKTGSMPNWTWATFEHVRNAPDRVQVQRGQTAPPYTFFDPKCAPATAPQCQPNRKPQPGDPRDRPIQVVREVPLPPYVKQLNAAVHALIEKASPKSVFRNYVLVNAMWPQSGEGFSVGAHTPLSQGAAAPTTGLANATAETYVQHATCLDCHQSAPIACSSASGPNPSVAADYTFQLSRASEPHRPAFCGSQDD
jgi:hypothetical protein